MMKTIAFHLHFSHCCDLFIYKKKTIEKKLGERAHQTNMLISFEMLNNKMKKILMLHFNVFEKCDAFN